MTEDEWLRSSDPEPMFHFLATLRARSQSGFLRSLFRSFASETERRKQDRLFICACHRRLWEFLTEAERDFVVTYEDYVLGLTEEDSVTQRWQAIWSVEQNELIEALTRPVLGGVNMSYPDPWWQAEENDPASWALDLRSRLDEDAMAGEAAAQASLLRHVFGNPFRPHQRLLHIPTIVRDLAEAMYQKELTATGPLHDALLDAGFTDLAEHFRDPTEWHPNGCWAIELLTERV
jgi:hypothetical protein